MEPATAECSSPLPRTGCLPKQPCCSAVWFSALLVAECKGAGSSSLREVGNCSACASPALQAVCQDRQTLTDCTAVCCRKEDRLLRPPARPCFAIPAVAAQSLPIYPSTLPGFAPLCPPAFKRVMVYW